jgi:hypothetical protein
MEENVLTKKANGATTKQVVDNRMTVNSESFFEIVVAITKKPNQTNANNIGIV